MNLRILILLAACLSAWPQQTSVQRKLQVLIITGREDHDWRGATPLMRQYLGPRLLLDQRWPVVYDVEGPVGSVERHSHEKILPIDGVEWAGVK